MEHIDWLHPDHIILANSSTSPTYKEFTKDMRSREFNRLRMIRYKEDFFIRYVIDDKQKWYWCSILQQKVKDYYISVNRILDSKSGWSHDELEQCYIKFNREDNLNQLLK
jgi:hypoxanthine phosphoribosyltransferase